MKLVDVTGFIIIMSVILCLHYFNWIDLIVVHTGFLVVIVIHSVATYTKVCALEEVNRRKHTRKLNAKK